MKEIERILTYHKM